MNNSLKSVLAPLAGPLLFAIVYFSELGLEPKQSAFLAIFVFVVYNWLIAWLPLFVTGFLGVSLAVMFGVEQPAQAMSSFAHPIIFLFLTGFLFAKAMNETGLDERISFFILGRKAVSKSFDRLLFSLFGISAFFSMWVSNTATTAMMLPIVLGVAKSLNIKDDKTIGYMLMGLAYSSSVGGLGSPVGSPPNIIAMGMLKELAGIEISFFEWTLFGAPLACAFLFIIFSLIRRKIPLETKQLNLDFISSEVKKLSPIGAREIWLMCLFSLLLVCWFLPGLLKGVLGSVFPVLSTIEARMEPGAVGLLLSAGLFVFPLKGSAKLLSTNDIRDIDWGSLLLFGSGLSLGKMLFDTGLAQIAGDFLVNGVAGSSHLVLISALCFFTIFFTELASNTASANILIPIVIASAGILGVQPHGLVIAVALACSLAFMLPVATPPNAIVYGSGKVDAYTMMKFGLGINIICGAFLSLIFYFLNFLL